MARTGAVYLEREIMKKETLKKIEYLVAALLTAAVLGVCVYQLRYGVDVQDTASYLTKFRYFFEKVLVEMRCTIFWENFLEV